MMEGVAGRIATEGRCGGLMQGENGRFWHATTDDGSRDTENDILG